MQMRSGHAWSLPETRPASSRDTMIMMCQVHHLTYPAPTGPQRRVQRTWSRKVWLTWRRTPERGPISTLSYCGQVRAWPRTFGRGAQVRVHLHGHLSGEDPYQTFRGLEAHWRATVRDQLTRLHPKVEPELYLRHAGLTSTPPRPPWRISSPNPARPHTSSSTQLELAGLGPS